MYSRNYFESELPSPAVPENYVGTAFGATEADDGQRDLPSAPPDEPASAVPAAKSKQTSRGGIFSSLNLPFLESLRLPNIGSEEILIIAVALFLFFSQNGDKECAVILLLLLLVN